MKLGTKIAGGFAILLVIAIGLGVLAVVNMWGVEADSTKLADEYVPELALAGDLERQSYETMYNMRGYGLTGIDRYHTAATAAMKDLNATIQKTEQLADRAKHLVKLKGEVSNISAKVEDYAGLVQETVDAQKSMDGIQERLDENATKYMTNANEFMKSQDAMVKEDIANAVSKESMRERVEKVDRINQIIYLGEEIRISVFKAQARREPEVINEGLALFPKVEEHMDAMARIITVEVNKRQLAAIRESAAGYKKAMEDYLKIYRNLTGLGQKRDTTGGEVLSLAQSLSKAGAEAATQIASEAKTALNSASFVMVVGLIVAIFAGVILAYVITVGITRPINRIIGGLNESSDQVASASGQISAASQSLAEGATEQAASLEESSSALEEMASMTRQNADNAGNANTMMAEARKQVDDGAGAVKNMAGAMGEISQSSEEIGKIIKTIEEIAFQTNLLALNAAVEAARAGDAGKGFAVVADEVRNLAQRSAQAARDTADLIESTVARVKNGTEIVGNLEKSFAQIEESSGKVAGLVSEISAASQEQAQGVDQVNTAVAQMDKVTQTNAANAEESASSSEELSAQAEQLRSIVEELAALVGGASASRSGTSYATPAPARKAVAAPAVHHHGGLAHPPAKKKNGGGAKVMKPNDVIPLDEDEDFSEF